MNDDPLQPCGVRPPLDMAYLPCELAQNHAGAHTFEPFEPLSSLTAVERAQLKYRVVAEYRALELEKDGLKNDLAEICEGISELGKVLAEHYGGAGGNHEICAKAARILLNFAQCKAALVPKP